MSQRRIFFELSNCPMGCLAYHRVSRYGTKSDAFGALAFAIAPLHSTFMRQIDGVSFHPACLLTLHCALSQHVVKGISQGPEDGLWLLREMAEVALYYTRSMSASTPRLALGGGLDVHGHHDSRLMRSPRRPRSLVFAFPLSGWNIQVANTIAGWGWRQVRRYGHSNLRWWPWTTQCQGTSTSPRLHHTFNIQA